MSSPEVEKFEISDRDWDDAINIGKGGGPRRMSKNKSLFGVWADSDSDDGGSRSYGKARKGKANYAAPMSFVSGGIKQGDKIVQEGDENDEEAEPSVETSQSNHYLNSRGGDKKQKRNDGVFFTKDSDFGKWERHTKGIGQKLLEKMGYEPGKGLGVRSQGITMPVEAHKRRNTKATIAYYGSERPASSVSAVEDETTTEKSAPHVQQWRKRGPGKKKAQYAYKTVQEVIDSGSRRKNIRDTSTAEAKVKVIDMTGREQKVMSGYRSLSKRHDRPDDEDDLDTEPADDASRVFDVPELTHNLDLLLDMAEEEIILNDRQIRHGQDRVVNMKYEKERLGELCVEGEKQLERMKRIVAVIDRCEERMKPGCEDRLTLDEAASLFKALQDECYEEYKLYDLASLSVVVVFPLMREYLLNWRPLTDPLYGLDVMRQWRYLIEDTNRQFQQDATTCDPYQRLVWDVHMPFIRTAILNCDIRKCEAVISFLEHWMPAFPTWILENILSQLIMPRLVQEVDKWNPLTDTMPIHLWLQPWLPLIGERLVPLYAPIRHKLANALTNWHPSDVSAKLILRPWVGVFKAGQMEAFVVKNILPKLAACIQDFAINPHNQLLDPWNWVMAWTDLIPLDSLVVMLDKSFFPRWQQVLIAWLTSQPNYEEVRNWYLGWKSMFPDKFLNHPTVKDHLSKALDFMNQAVSGKLSTSTKDNAAQLRPDTQSSRVDRREITVTPKSTVSSMTYSFKDLIERKAEENALLFMPMPGKTHEAKQVYRFGCKQIYMDRNVIFMYDNQKWVPVSLQNLMESSR